ncbi:MAG: hypothetical protein QG656_1576 [Candidatus Hydrogenedentes bacterium]|nr:hypothetical protein [Candidatus Hydrogenedentota bacterium]
MAKRPVLPQPTPAEWAILGVLWEKGPCTVRDVYDALKDRSAKGYTTVLKLMQIMAQKGLVLRDERQKTHIYRACAAEERTQRQLVHDLVDRVFSGSAERLVMRALEEKKVSAEELGRIRKLLDEIEGDRT